MKQRYELQRFDNDNTQILNNNSYDRNSQGTQFKMTDPDLGNKIIDEEENKYKLLKVLEDNN